MGSEEEEPGLLECSLCSEVMGAMEREQEAEMKLRWHLWHKHMGAHEDQVAIRYDRYRCSTCQFSTGDSAIANFTPTICCGATVPLPKTGLVFKEEKQFQVKLDFVDFITKLSLKLSGGHSREALIAEVNARNRAFRAAHLEANLVEVVERSQREALARLSREKLGGSSEAEVETSLPPAAEEAEKLEQCPLCGKRWKSAEELKAHMMEEEVKAARVLACKVCGLTWLLESERFAHVASIKRDIPEEDYMSAQYHRFFDWPRPKSSEAWKKLDRALTILNFAFTRGFLDKETHKKDYEKIARFEDILKDRP